MKDKSHMIISIDAGKAFLTKFNIFDKKKTPPNKVGIKETYLNIPAVHRVTKRWTRPSNWTTIRTTKRITSPVT